MAALITYDIPNKHREFKTEMFALGYLDNIPGENCEVIYFPNTSLYHPTKTPKNARDDSRSICSKLDILLERCIATVWDEWSAICGEPFK